MSSLSGSSGYGGSRGSRQGDMIPKGYRQGQLQTFDKNQMGLYNQSFDEVGPDSYLSRLSRGDEDTFNQMEAPAMRQFSQLMGGIGSRFSGMGMGGKNSSAYQNATTSATSNFAQELQSNRQNLMRQAIQDLRGLRGDLLAQRPQDRFLVEKQKKQNPWGQIVGNLAGQIPGAVANYATGGGYGSAKSAYNFVDNMNQPSSYVY